LLFFRVWSACLSLLLSLRLALVLSFFFLYCSRAPRDLHSFPTRRSSDLTVESLRSLRTSLHFAMMDAGNNVIAFSGPSPGIGKRSEEHTSELQSRFDLVCRLLLEKKKETTTTEEHNIHT